MKLSTKIQQKIKELEIDKVKTYLHNNSFLEHGNVQDKAIIFHNKQINLVVTLPINKNMADYDLRLAELVIELTEAKDCCVCEIIHEINNG